MRIRYASRTNIDKIFAQYDADDKGYVDANDLHTQARRIGVRLTLNDAQVLIQSCKAGNDGIQGLNVDEF